MASPPVTIENIPVYDLKHLPDQNRNYDDGALFLIDKPETWTSFDVVKFLRNRIRTRKTGHAGTLDPLATGLLIVCSGKATRLVSQIQEMPKCYHAFIRFGASTPSYDLATQPDEIAPFEHITPEKAEEIIRSRFTGTIRQLPPMYSAIQKKGRRLYKYARKGQVVERDPREVEIYDTRIISWQNQTLELYVRCSKGTYIRALAHDLGLALESRAHLYKLRRTETGPFHVENALTTDRIRSLFDHQL